MFQHPKTVFKSPLNLQPELVKDNPEERLGKSIIEHFQRELKCSICWRYMYRCTTIAPCLHNFCSFCLSEYLSTNYWQAICPLCRGELQSWNKNLLVDRLIECLGGYNSEFQTSEEEKELRDGRDMLIKGIKLQKHEWRGIYFGFLKIGKKEGRGKFMNYLSDEYDGELVDDKKEGYGELNCSDGRKYKGEWKNDQNHGFGEFTSPDGSHYKGEWKYGKFDGFGEFTGEDGGKYKGYFKNGVEEGQGEWRSSNGDFYKGEWKNGKRHSFGGLTWSNGWQEVGMWEDNRFCGLTQVRGKERRWRH